jgi:hypothetical protein
MAQTPARDRTRPVNRPPGGMPPASAPSPDAALRAVPPAAARIAGVDGLRRPGARRARVCILCGHPLRAGQRLLRVHGTTVHARCSDTS